MNPLTGDYDAVVQIADRTINRLMATLHQNTNSQSNLPTHPHILSFRIAEDDNSVRVFGWLSAQLGVPRIILQDRVTDRFDLEIPIRARFHTEGGSASLPEYIHGTVRATYRMTKIRESCPGWRNRAADHLWLRVIKSSVRFTGTATDDVPVITDPGVHGRIERVLADLLDDRFEAAPHPVGPEFQQGQLLSLKSGGQSAVALPIYPDGAKPPGARVSSIDSVFLGGHDFAVALATPWLMDQVVSAFNELIEPIEVDRTFTTKVHGPFGIGITVDRTRVRVTGQITSSAFDWRPHGFGASIHFVVSGELHGWLSATFTVEDVIGVSFNSLNESLRFLHGAHPDVNVSADVPWYLDLLGFDDDIERAIRDKTRNTVSNALANLEEIPLAKHHAKLGRQLKTLDAKGSAAFVGADFRDDAIVLGGRIKLTKRRRPVVEFTKLPDETGFSALGAWAPGGWIERFVWTYRPDYQPSHSQTLRHRFVLLRPSGPFSRWGKQALTEPAPRLPGIDGYGEVCLEIRGYQIDSVTGKRVSFTARTCHRYASPFSMGRLDHAGKLLVTVRSPSLSKEQTRELGVMEFSIPRVHPGATNNLVVYAGDSVDRETTRVLVDGLAGSKRDDAGLMVLLIIDEAAGAAHGAALAKEASELSDRLGAHAQIVENAAESWTRRLALAPGEPGWRLLTPNGGFTWAHDGALSPEELATALDNHLRTAGRPTFEQIDATLPIGSSAPPWTATVPVRRPRRTCPRIYTKPFGYLVTFVRADSRASERQLAEWRVRPEDYAAVPLFAVVDGDDEQALRIAERHPDIEVIADPAGTISDRFGVRIWPTVMGVEDGLISGIQCGFVEYDAPSPVRWDAEPVDEPHPAEGARS